MTWWKGLIAAVILVAVAGFTIAGLRERPPPPAQVQLATAHRAPIIRSVAGAGKVQAATTVKISSNISGDLIELRVRTGDRVAKGQVLGQIERRRFEAAAKQAQAAQSVAKSEIEVAQVESNRTAAELGRVSGLFEKGMASAAEVERARADRDAAAARLASATQRYTQSSAAFDEAQTALSKTTLVSPIDGNVIEVTREVGERVRGSDFNEDVVLTIAALADMEVKIEVGEHEVVYLKNGQRADVSVDALENQTFEGTVVEIAQKATIKNPGTEAEVTTFPVTVALTTRPPGVLPGMSAEVKITTESRENALVVPVQAVTVRSEKALAEGGGPREAGTSLSAPKKTEALVKVVFVVDGEKKVKARRVRTGISSDTDVEILDGLTEGDKLVEGPYRTLAKDLKDGDSVEESTPGQPRPGMGRT